MRWSLCGLHLNFPLSCLAVAEFKVWKKITDRCSARLCNLSFAEKCFARFFGNYFLSGLATNNKTFKMNIFKKKHLGWKHGLAVNHFNYHFFLQKNEHLSTWLEHNKIYRNHVWGKKKSIWCLLWICSSVHVTFTDIEGIGGWPVLQSDTSGKSVMKGQNSTELNEVNAS